MRPHWYDTATDKNVYIDKKMLQAMQLIFRRQKSRKNRWDNLIVIDGKERAGKSTLARQLAYILAKKKGKEEAIKAFNKFEMLEKITDSLTKIMAGQLQNLMQKALNDPDVDLDTFTRNLKKLADTLKTLKETQDETKSNIEINIGFQNDK